MIHLFRNHKQEKPIYLERIDEFPSVDIIRLKGRIDQTTIPAVESRIQENRQTEGTVIDKNVVVDFLLVDHVDSATIAFHMIHLREFQEKGFRIGFINVHREMKVFIEMFEAMDAFKIFASEEEALKELNK